MLVVRCERNSECEVNGVRRLHHYVAGCTDSVSADDSYKTWTSSRHVGRNPGHRVIKGGSLCGWICEGRPCLLAMCIGVFWKENYKY